MLLAALLSTGLALQAVSPLDEPCARTLLGRRPVHPERAEDVLGRPHPLRLRANGDKRWHAFRYQAATGDTLVVRLAGDEVRRYGWSGIDQIDRRERLGVGKGALIGFYAGLVAGPLWGAGECGIPCALGMVLLGPPVGAAVGAAGLTWIPVWNLAYCGAE